MVRGPRPRASAVCTRGSDRNLENCRLALSVWRAAHPGPGPGPAAGTRGDGTAARTAPHRRGFNARLSPTKARHVGRATAALPQGPRPARSASARGSASPRPAARTRGGDPPARCAPHCVGFGARLSPVKAGSSNAGRRYGRREQPPRSNGLYPRPEAGRAAPRRVGLARSWTRTRSEATSRGRGTSSVCVPCVGA
jgi:hypothetical protein